MLAFSSHVLVVESSVSTRQNIFQNFLVTVMNPSSQRIIGFCVKMTVLTQTRNRASGQTASESRSLPFINCVSSGFGEEKQEGRKEEKRRKNQSQQQPSALL